MYIADFYSRIIEQTLPPLDQDDRDQKRGRIWGVIYRGPDKTAGLPPVPDLDAAPLESLLRFLGDARLVLRTHATHQLVERIGSQAIEPLQKLLGANAHPWQRAHAAWCCTG